MSKFGDLGFLKTNMGFEISNFEWSSRNQHHSYIYEITLILEN